MKGKQRTQFVFTACLVCAMMLSGCQRDPAQAQSPETQQQIETGQQNEAGQPEAQPSSAGDTAVLDAIAASYSTKEFAAGQVADAEIQQILLAGNKAPSARNSQPWHFTVITGGEKVSQIVSGAAEGNVVIVIAGLEQAEEGINVDFDCALATENMYLAAQSLGLGAHIYTGPVRSVNEDKTGYGIPDGYEAVAVLCIGQVANPVDAAASATARHDLDGVVSYIE